VSCNARRPGTVTSYLWVSRARAGRIKSIRGTADTTITTLLAGARPTLWGQATGIAREMYPTSPGRAPRRGRRWPSRFAITVAAIASSSPPAVGERHASAIRPRLWRQNRAGPQTARSTPRWHS
jgi:hypothetical protein